MDDQQILKRMEESDSDKEITNLLKELSDDGKTFIRDKTNVKLKNELISFVDSEINSFQYDVSQFLHEHIRIWGEGFKASRFLYQLIIEAEKANAKIIEKLPGKEFQKKECSYRTIKALYGRGLQQYGEILVLAENGYPDGAYARTRSLYEVTVFASFIVNQKNSEEVAKAYHDQSMNSKSKTYEWARIANCFSGFQKDKYISLEDIGKRSSIQLNYFEVEKRYKLANSLVHAYPESTFGRLGGVGTKQFGENPIGRSHFNIAPSVCDAAICLIEISMYFFNLFPEFDDGVNLQRIRVWGDRINAIYKTISEENNL